MSIAVVADPWAKEKTLATYVLVPDTVPATVQLPEGTVVHTPLRRAVLTSSIHAALLLRLGVADAIAGMTDTAYVVSSDIRRLLRSGKVTDVGSSVNPDAERIKQTRADALFAEVQERDFDAIVLPGGGAGTDNLMKSEAVNDRLRRQKDEGRLICAICAAPTVLVEAGVLEPGQHVTCYPTCSVDLDRPCANVPVVADGNVITGQAPGAATLFALVVLQALSGEKVAQKVARGMVTDVL